MIGVILKTVEAYVTFLQFRKEWYVDTKLILDVRDIDDNLEYIVSDMPLGVQSKNLLIYGKDIKRFEELANYVDVSRAKPFGANFVVDSDKLRDALPVIELEDDFFNDLYAEFSDIMYDSRDMPGLDFQTDGLTADEIERKKASKIAEILAERAAKKKAEEEAIRLEQERLRKEEEERNAEAQRLEEERKAEEERIANEKREAELKAAKEEAERLLLEANHQAELTRIQAEAEEKARLAKLEAEKIALEEKERNLQLEAQERLIAERAKALESGKLSIGSLSATNLSALLNQSFSVPNIQGYSLPQSNNKGGLRIGRKTSKQAPQQRVYIVAGAMKDCGSSTLAYNLAYSVAKKAPRTLLIDLDFIDNDLTHWLEAENIPDCGVDMIFRGMPFDKYISTIENSTVKVSLHKRVLSFIGCNKLINYTADNKTILRNFDYINLLAALQTKFDSIIVDIGCIAQPEVYQTKLLSRIDTKNIVCYGASCTADINESIQNVYNVSGLHNAVLAKAPPNINRLQIEKFIRRPIMGVVVKSDRYYPGCNYLYEEDEDMTLRRYWEELLSVGGVR